MPTYISTGRLVSFFLTLFLIPVAGYTQEQDQDAGDQNAVEVLESLEVIGVTPLHGVGLELYKIPANVQTADGNQLQQQQSLDLTQFLSRNLYGVSINDTQNNPLQPDLQFRGFVASPLLGLPQGISVYQDGVRINEPFGDTVNWALIPQSAISSINLIPGSNPVYGLNTLGGALSIQTKNGFTHPGYRGQVQAGSWNRVVAEAEAGGSVNEDVGYYITGWFFDEDGWRDFSPSQAGQLFGNLIWRSERNTLDLNVSWAETDLIGNGPAPSQLLDNRRESIFTRPDQTRNEPYWLVNLRGSHQATTDLVFNTSFYYRKSDISSLNGDDSDFAPCAEPGNQGLMCSGVADDEDAGDNEDGEEVALNQSGNPIAAGANVEGATINRSNTKQDGFGGTVQATLLKDIAGRDNQLIIGGSIDIGNSDFDASTELGRLDATRLAIGSGSLVSQSFTRVKSDTENYGIFFTDTFSITPKLALNLAGRYNQTSITLRDQLGTALNGDHDFDRFNPAIGFTYSHSPQINFYTGYNESNRAPSPVELSCADPDDPCRLPNAFLSDPPLEQVVARTIEAGIRGDWQGKNWHLGIFRTENRDDILFISSGPLTNQGFFDNVGTTRRQGIELSLDGQSFERRLDWFINYSYLEATFQENFKVSSPNNPLAVDGEIEVNSGDRIPGLPKHIIKVGANYFISPKFSFGGTLSYQSSQFLRGDEANLNDPISGFTLLSLFSEYRASQHVTIFAKVDNVLNEKYENFGLFGEADEVLGEAFDDNRFLGPGAPIAAWGGLRLTF